jgi:hypothetical protein
MSMSSRRSASALLPLFVAVFSVVSCDGTSGAPELVGDEQLALSSKGRQTQPALDPSTVMGFESTLGWTTKQGTLVASDKVTEGKSAIAVTNVRSGHIDISSIDIKTPHGIGKKIGFDLFVPSSAKHDTSPLKASLFLGSLKRGCGNSSLGSVWLPADAAGKWNTVTFDVPDSLLAKITGALSDLSFRIVITGPPRRPDPFILDNLRFNPIAISVVASKTELCPGEDVLVEASAPSGGRVFIDGIEGARRYVEFGSVPGTRQILVSVRSPSGSWDFRVQNIRVRDCSAESVSVQPTLTVAPSVFEAHQFEFLITNAAELGVGDSSYVWTFGDGETLTTTSPFVKHSYVRAMPPTAETANFEAVVDITRGGRSYSTRKTVSIWNHYAFNRVRGTIQAPAKSLNPRLRRVKIQNAFFKRDYIEPMRVELTNIESGAISFDAAVVETQPCDGNVDPVETNVALTTPVIVAAHAQTTATVSVPLGAATTGACGIALQLSGVGPDGIVARAHAYFDVPQEPTLGQAPVTGELAEVLRQIVRDGLVSDPRSISWEDIRRLELEGKITVPFSGVGTSSAPGASAAPTERVLKDVPLDSLDGGKPRSNGPRLIAAVPDEDGEPDLGEECNPSSVGRPGLSCQATDDFASDVTQPRVANALKGDLLLHSECNLVGLALRQLTVPQNYTHEALMTQNYYQLRHHTATFDWYTANKNTLTIKTDYLRYGWPGSSDEMTMSTSDAFLGRNYLDPEGEIRRISAINLKPARCAGDLMLSIPLVVKPDREGYTPAVRARLKAAADFSKTIKGHYRLYGFTDGSTAITMTNGTPSLGNVWFDAPSSIGWANGTVAAVSSQFIWSALFLSGVHLEGSLDTSSEDNQDKTRDAFMDPKTLDGQYFYRAEDRRAGLEAMHNDIGRVQSEEGGTVFGSPGQVDDQIPNCFAWDLCWEDPVNDDWKSPGVGRTTSPNNFLFWDKPKYGGSYGYSEPLVYRSGGFRRIHQWTATADSGNVQVTVLRDADGSVAQGARATLMGLDIPVDNFGQARFEAIPAGTYEVEATLTEENPPVAYRGKALVVVTPRGESAITVRLVREASFSRLVSFIGTIKAKDAETWWPDEHKTWKVNRFCFVSPDQRADTFTFKECLGDEVVVKLKVTCELLGEDNLTVNIKARGELHESTGCGDELEASAEELIELGPGESYHLNFAKGLNDDDPVFGGDSNARFDLTVSNLEQAP